MSQGDYMRKEIACYAVLIILYWIAHQLPEVLSFVLLFAFWTGAYRYHLCARRDAAKQTTVKGHTL